MENGPEAYRIGWVPFLGLTIWLDSHPLIPRPETEWWVEELLQELGGVVFGASASDGERHEKISSKKLFVPKNGTTEFAPLKRTPALSVLDLCAGSGAIGCAFLKYVPNATVYFGEIDPAHAATIRKNIRANELDESRAVVAIGDLFGPFQNQTSDVGFFDVIAANPPYVPTGRKLDTSVEDFEPALALRASTDGLAVIRRIAAQIPRYLKKGGVAWVECDSEHAEAARDLFTAQGLSATIKNDQYERPRIIVISF